MNCRLKIHVSIIQSLPPIDNLKSLFLTKPIYLPTYIVFNSNWYCIFNQAKSHKPFWFVLWHWHPFVASYSFPFIQVLPLVQVTKNLINEWMDAYLLKERQNLPCEETKRTKGTEYEKCKVLCDEFLKYKHTLKNWFFFLRCKTIVHW